MTHLLDAYIEASRAGDAALAASIAESSVDRYASPQFAPTVVLEPVEVAAPVKPPLMTQYPASLIPRPVFAPTAPYVGDETGGGINIPFSAGPVSLMTIPPVIGTMLIMIAGRVAVSIAVRGAGDAYGHLKKLYHRRDAKMRVHTGVGRKGLGRVFPKKKTALDDGFDPSLPDGSDRVQPRGDAHPGQYSLDDWSDVPILGGPAFNWGPVSHEWINTYGPEFGSWL